MDNLPPRHDWHPPNGGSPEFRPFGDRARAWLFALLAVLLVFATEQVIEHFAQQRALEQERSRVLNQVSALRARLEGVVNANLFLVHGLTAVIAAQPDIDQSGFSAIARGLVDERHALRNIAGAPNMVISLMYPLAGNETALGLDYRTHAGQRDAALRARDIRQPVIAGPLTLQQGGVAIIVREPVFLAPSQPGGERQFWGLVSAVIDVRTLYRQTGLDTQSTGLRLALRGADGTGSRGPVFFGDATLFGHRPVTIEVTLPGGSWQLAALPVKGWGHSNSSVDLIRLLGLLVALAAGVMAYRLTRSTHALARQNARMRALLNTIPDLVWLKDPSGAYLTCNPRVEDFFGAGEADIRGKTDHDFVPVTLADSFRRQDRAAIAAGGPRVDEEWVTFASDGHRALLEIIKAPVTDAAGRLVGVLGIARDITARKLAEAALQESESRLQLFIDHAPAALAMFDRQMRYLAASRRWLKDYQLEGGDVLGRSHYEVFAEMPERWKAAHRRGLAGEVVGADEDRYERVDGTVQWLRWEVRPWYAADGAVGGIVIFTEDVSDRKRAEAGLRRQRDLLDRTSRMAHVGGWEFDVATLRGSWTDETAHIHDLEPSAEVTVAEGLNFYPGESRRLIEQAVRDAIESAQSYDLELEFLSAKGVRKWVRTIGLPVVEDTKVARMEGAIQDITERKLAEAQARQGELVLNSVFQALPDLFFLIDQDGTIRDYRAQSSADLYVPPEAFIGKRMQDVLPAPVAAQLELNIAAVHRQGGIATYEYELALPHGARHFEARLCQMPDSGQFVAVVRDITERIQIEAALAGQREETAFLANLVERSSQPLAVGYPDGSLGRYNQAFLDLVGYSREEMARIDWATDLTPAHWRDAEMQALERLNQSHLPVRYEKEYMRKDGSIVPIELHVDVVTRPDGAPEYYYAFATDISARKRAEALLEKQRQMLSDSQRIAHIGSWEFDLFAGSLTWSEETYRIYGVSPESFEPSPEAFIGLVHPDDRPAMEQFGALILAGKESHDVQFRILRPDGTLRTISGQGIVVNDSNGRPIRTVGTAQDITALKQAEAALREQEEFFRLIAENMGDMVSVLDREGRLLYGSPSYRALFGDPEALKGADTFTNIHPDDRDQVRLSFRAAVETGVGQRVDLRVVLPDGNVRDIESQCGVIRDHGGEVMRAVVVSRDVTERKRMEDEIRQLNAELEDRVRQRTAELATANKELETFTYSVSHDLKAPLRGIDGYSRLLLEDHQDQLNEEGRLFLKKVQDGVEQMNQLIVDLLSYSRMERRSMNGRALDLSREVAKVVDERQADIEARGMIVDVALQALSARADPEGLAIVLRNLVDNALKFTRDCQPPTLSITANPCERSVVLAIRDNGIGFDMQFHDRIFEIFHRLQRVEDYPGTGVGLAIVCNAMHRMGGRVWAESAPRQGATFYLELPR